MNKFGKLLIAMVVPFGALAWASAANASPILHFGQTSNTNTVTATRVGTTTTIAGTDIAVSITQILAAVITPTSAFLTLNATNTGPAATFLGSIGQQYSGTFSITSLAGGLGTNYLSGTFSDTAFGTGSSLALTSSDPTDSIVFSSDVINALFDPTSITFSLANVTPQLSIVNTTLNSFTASVSGDFSGTAVPEPGTLLLCGTALVGWGVMVRRRRKSS